MLIVWTSSTTPFTNPRQPKATQSERTPASVRMYAPYQPKRQHEYDMRHNHAYSRRIDQRAHNLLAASDAIVYPWRRE